MGSSSLLQLLNGLLLVHALLIRNDSYHAFTHQGKREVRQLNFGLSDFEIGVEDHELSCWRRRTFLGSTLFLLQQPGVAVADVETTANFDALLDLPPITQGCVRIFLCRHGQTENNRLRKVQGARVDPPINPNGAEQAINLGKTLRRLDPTPNMFFSSNLQRAQMTARIAAAEIDSNLKVRQLDSLAEVDFGPIAEGRPVALAKAGMQATYAAWAIGNVDFRPQEGGDSGREVLERAVDSIGTLAAAASKSDKGCCVAVTHSTFLRILLALVSNVPLFEAASMSVVNGCISVIDVPRDVKTRRLGKRAKFFGGVPTEDFAIEVPICHVIRINETRHLPTVPVVA